MSKESFEDLLHIFGNEGMQHGLYDNSDGPGRQPVPVRKQVLLTIWYLSCGTETLISIGSRFGVCEATSYRVRKRVLRFLGKVIHKKVVKLPSTLHELMDLIRGLREITIIL
jgi:hypothetical protein